MADYNALGYIWHDGAWYYRDGTPVDATQTVKDAQGNIIGISLNGVQYPLTRRGYNRPPDVTDNASKGYTLASIWQAGGRLYKPVTAPDNVSAAWAVQPMPAGCFTDIVGATNTIFAGGMKAQKLGYTGPAVQLTATIATAPVTLDIAILPSGDLDNLAVQNFLSLADAGTVVTITKIYDQSGKGNHLIKSASYPAPLIEWDEVLQSYIWGDLPGNSTVIRTLQFPAGTISGGVLTAGFGVVGNSCSVYAVGRGVNAADNGKATLCVLGDALNPTVPDRRTLTTLTNVNGYMNVSKNGTNQVFVPKIPLDSQPSVLITSLGAVNSIISINEDIGTVAATSGANDTAVYTGGYLNCITPSSPDYHGSHRGMALCIANVALTAAQMTLLRNAAYVRYDIRPQVMDQIFCVGDSRTARIQLNQNTIMGNWPLELVSRIGRDYRVYGMGNSGIRASQIPTNQLPAVLGYFKPTAKNIAFFLAGVNDLANGDSVDTTLASIQANTFALKGAGFQTILLNELATTSTSNGVNVKLPLLRAVIAAQGVNGMGCDAIYDPMVFTPFTQPSNALYYPDGLHPAPALESQLASGALPYISIPA